MEYLSQKQVSKIAFIRSSLQYFDLHSIYHIFIHLITEIFYCELECAGTELFRV